MLCLQEIDGATSEITHEKDFRDIAIEVEALYRRADGIGAATAALVRRQVERKRHPDETLRSIQGILRLAKEYGESALEVAASQAMRCARSAIVPCSLYYNTHNVSDGPNWRSRQILKTWIAAQHAVWMHAY